MANDEPQWELLPHDPVGFFGLDASFDRKDLKRSYNRWLRRFKPEKFPEEFQRIRAAYEAVDERLRYLDQSGVGDLSQAAASRPIDGEPAAEPIEPEVAPGPDFEELLHERGPEVAFAELCAGGPASPVDSYRLAVLSDVVESADPRGFVGWLVEGLRRWPMAAEPRELLYAYCHRPEAVDAAADLLLQLTEIGDPGLYGYLTERLWCRYIEAVPFAEVARLFERCRRGLDADYHPAVAQLSSVVFRASLFKADDAWIEGEWERLVDAEMVGDGDLLEVLFEYRFERAEFLSGAPARELVDRVVQAVASGDIVRADRAFLAMQVEFGAAGRELLDAFPRGDRDWFAASAILNYHHYDRSQRYGEDATPGLSRKEVANRTAKLLRKLDRLSNHGLLGIGWNLSLIALTFGLPVLAILVAVWIFKSLDGIGPKIGLTIGWVLVAGFGYWRFFFSRRGSMNQWFADRIYRDIWRPEVLDFVLDTRIDRDQLLESIRTSREDVMTKDHVFTGIARDAGMAFASFAK